MRYRIAHDAVTIDTVSGHNKPGNGVTDLRFALRARTTYLNAAFIFLGNSAAAVLMQYN
jgi:hypothetical protein